MKHSKPAPTAAPATTTDAADRERAIDALLATVTGGGGATCFNPAIAAGATCFSPAVAAGATCFSPALVMMPFDER